VQTGSHTDAIPLAGAYDGTLGVLGGIAALRALRAAGFRPQRGIEVIMFTSEEPTRFALGCSGRSARARPRLKPHLPSRRFHDFLVACAAPAFEFSTALGSLVSAFPWQSRRAGKPCTVA
jgi:hypothetical protein